MPVDRAMAYLGECRCDAKAELPTIIGFAGYARAGKDTCADFMAQLFNGRYTRSAFANRLKYECGLMLSMVTDDFPDLHETEAKIKYRDFLVFWGKYRRQMQPDYWIEKLEDEHGKPAGSRTIISDVRYLNEAEWIIGKGGVVVLVERPGVGPANGEEAGSIGNIKRYTMYDYIVRNDGSIPDLKGNLMKLAARLSEALHDSGIYEDFSRDP